MFFFFYSLIVTFLRERIPFRAIQIVEARALASVRVYFSSERFFFFFLYIDLFIYIIRLIRTHVCSSFSPFTYTCSMYVTWCLCTAKRLQKLSRRNERFSTLYGWPIVAQNFVHDINAYMYTRIYRYFYVCHTCTRIYTYDCTYETRGKIYRESKKRKLDESSSLTKTKRE